MGGGVDAHVEHDIVQSLNRVGRWFEIPHPITVCDVPWSSFVLVEAVDDLGTRALRGEESNHAGEILVGGSVEDCFTVGVDGVDVRSQFQQIRCYLNCLGLSARHFFGGLGAHSGRGHQRGAVVFISERGIGTQFDKEFQQGDVCGRRSQ